LCISGHAWLARAKCLKVSQTSLFLHFLLTVLFVFSGYSVKQKITDLKILLDNFYREYDFKTRLLHDPIEFPHRYKNPGDIEIAALIASSLAYGKVDLFKPVVEKILSVMGASPHRFILGFRLKKDRKLFQGLKYRFNENEDLVALMFILHKTLKSKRSLENAFMKFYSPDSKDIGEALSGFIGSLLEVDTSVVYGENLRPLGLKQFFPSPADGSACKRMNLFLRWMVRDRDIDFGIWRGIPKNKLVIPLDTHIARISRCLGFTERKSQDWKTAIEITDALKRFDPEDPLKYDFALCHHGISGVCKGTRDTGACTECVFKADKLNPDYS
jgi:uncharacterized protein (TIGR02757 family)